MREGRRQIWRHDAGNQECQPDEAEAVQDEQRPQRFGPFPEAEFRPDISSGDDSPRDEAECDAHEKPDHLLWHDECLLFRMPAIDVAMPLLTVRSWQIRRPASAGGSLRAWQRPRS